MSVDAADFAATQVAAVREDPRGRLALAQATYYGPVGRVSGGSGGGARGRRLRGGARRHLPFGRAEMSFMRWELRRGVLNPLSADPPGSAWWRALNERLVRDGCEAVARAGGRGGAPSSATIATWMRFVREPTARNWYRAHNASIVAAYLEHVDLAERENGVERFFLNVVLLRVLYAHALVAAPRLALGRTAALGRMLGDPRLGMAGAFLSLERVLPDRYPAPDRLDFYLESEHRLGRMLDYAVIVPRLQALYEWSAAELGHPELSTLICAGSPIYAWRYADREVWRTPPLPRAARALAYLTGPRERAVTNSFSTS